MARSDRRTGRCDCGAAIVTIPACPERINGCARACCRKVGALRGYFPTQVMRATGIYLCATGSGGIHRCRRFGMTTHGRRRDGGGEEVGVRMSNFDPALIVNVAFAAGLR